MKLNFTAEQTFLFIFLFSIHSRVALRITVFLFVSTAEDAVVLLE